jgi:hypothetical protein
MINTICNQLAQTFVNSMEITTQSNLDIPVLKWCK